MRLKRFYSSREVASLTGLTARQLQGWDARRFFSAAVATKKTEAGGFTERRYSPLDVIELQLLADLLRRGFSVPQIRHLLAALRDVFGVRLYEVIGEEGPLTLRALRAAGDVPNAGPILQADVYGWFERVARGTYLLTPAGRVALEAETARA